MDGSRVPEDDVSTTHCRGVDLVEVVVQQSPDPQEPFAMRHQRVRIKGTKGRGPRHEIEAARALVDILKGDPGG